MDISTSGVGSTRSALEFAWNSSDDDRRMEPDTRIYRFTLTGNVEPGHPAYDDPEWAAAAAWGALTNDYGLRAIYTEIHEVEPDHDVDPALAAAWITEAQRERKGLELQLGENIPASNSARARSQRS